MDNTEDSPLEEQPTADGAGDEQAHDPETAQPQTAQPQAGTPQAADTPPMRRGSTPDTPAARDGSALAVVAFIFALLGLCPAFLPVPVIGVVFGHLARRQQRRAPAPVRGGALALAALVIGYSLIALYATTLGVGGTLIVMWRADAEHLDRCRENLDNLVRAVHQYAHAHGGQLPADLEELRPYFQDLDALLYCPVDSSRTSPSYEIVAEGYLDDPVRPESPVLLRETRRRHLFGRRVVCYLDGKTEVIQR